MDTQTDTNSTNEPSKLSEAWEPPRPKHIFFEKNPRLAKLIEKYGTDGCTASPDLNFRDCCEEHDYYYRSGEVSRAEADKRLRKCIQQRGWLVTPWLYWLGVRLFGRSSYKG
jgi:hypothetical protein